VAQFTNLDQMTPKPVGMEGAERVRIRVLLGTDQDVPNFVMRVFDVDPGGFTPRHTHPFEHEIFVLSGQGEIVLESGPHALAPGDAALVAPGEMHQFRNTADDVFQFMCIIPVPE
jgi:quercetin dioxygenase-like cupin family protein